MIGGGVVAAVVVISLVMPKNDTSGTVEDPTGNGSGSTTIPFNASYVAETLYDAMRETGTDEEAIINALKSVNPSNFQLVINKFGKRSYNSTVGNQYNYIPWGSLPLEPLKVWFKSELSATLYNTLRLKYQSLNYL